VVTSQRRSPGASVREVQGRPVPEIRGQLSFVRFRRDDDGSGGPSSGALRAPEVVRQLCFGDQAYEVSGVFGFEDETEIDCMICYSRPKNVLLLPCRHCSVCHSCLRSLRDEKCPLCRSSFTSYLTLPLPRARPPDVAAAPSASAPAPRPAPAPE
ncbi:unnamed protein product, partial [Polarella glacialis]